ncbi:WecB/TagA/CpsF family glycosyltransferase [Bacillus alveayuensis]|jgi:N-acetylglucosaminyldiphosphoundecaprenol N-acetyl-beta-D-mannosaminyltransferase|uniref:N-acetylglucosaminyldiphosphoundecaprenol N-acetyl-beta-D-mannosaminyltransferase n=1 Tax=Aeribacillus alveayuensis TaxID=279215 RepID=A0ABT9VMA6_9BACI|nr:WecB/TagA/CpsF family glycosyltransferase [Bacillus alveayuensis]MDQ0161895.1 N-acetylglucosaminyldiphosphoundecaprenol N-acetyl-beta-D-mannosaminyltransferase [Bacillus alveayuensis]
MKENILGVQISPLNYEQLISSLLKDIDEKRKAFIVAINPEKIMKAQEDEQLKELLNKATYQIPDGIGVILASRLKGGNIHSRVTGIDLMLKICEAAAKHHKKVFLYGAKPGIAEKAKEELIKQFPGLNIVGVLHGYEKDIDIIRHTINEAKPDIIFVALGSPRQEYWILENMNTLYPMIFQGVGGSFDVISGNLKRAPESVQKLGLEWLYRLIKEPWRWKRQLELPKFLLRVLKR